MNQIIFIEKVFVQSKSMGFRMNRYKLFVLLACLVTTSNNGRAQDQNEGAGSPVGGVLSDILGDLTEEQIDNRTKLKDMEVVEQNETEIVLSVEYDKLYKFQNVQFRAKALRAGRKLPDIGSTISIAESTSGMIRLKLSLLQDQPGRELKSDQVLIEMVRDDKTIKSKAYDLVKDWGGYTGSESTMWSSSTDRGSYASSGGGSNSSGYTDSYSNSGSSHSNSSSDYSSGNYQEVYPSSESTGSTAYEQGASGNSASSYVSQVTEQGNSSSSYDHDGGSNQSGVSSSPVYPANSYQYTKKQLLDNTCVNSIQGKIAWDYSGKKTWAQSNLDKLCLGAENSIEPGKCFNHVMHGKVNWGGGTNWQWGNALNLCAGTLNAKVTVECFEKNIKQGRSWSDAIASCKAH